MIRYRLLREPDGTDLGLLVSGRRECGTVVSHRGCELEIVRLVVAEVDEPFEAYLVVRSLDDRVAAQVA
jgi:hypothetical protein